jgi:hypothetical protein
VWSISRFTIFFCGSSRSQNVERREAGPLQVIHNRALWRDDSSASTEGVDRRALIEAGAGDQGRRRSEVPGAKTHGSHSKEKRRGFTVTLVPEPGVDGIKALRWVLKSALRKHGLKCTDVSLSASYTRSPLEKSEEETSKVGLVEGDLTDA